MTNSYGVKSGVYEDYEWIHFYMAEWEWLVRVNSTIQIDDWLFGLRLQPFVLAIVQHALPCA